MKVKGSTTAEQAEMDPATRKASGFHRPWDHGPTSQKGLAMVLGDGPVHTTKAAIVVQPAMPLPMAKVTWHDDPEEEDDEEEDSESSEDQLDEGDSLDGNPDKERDGMEYEEGEEEHTKVQGGKDYPALTASPEKLEHNDGPPKDGEPRARVVMPPEAVAAAPVRKSDDAGSVASSEYPRLSISEKEWKYDDEYVPEDERRRRRRKKKKKEEEDEEEEAWQDEHLDSSSADSMAIEYLRNADLRQDSRLRVSLELRREEGGDQDGGQAAQQVGGQDEKRNEGDAMGDCEEEEEEDIDEAEDEDDNEQEDDDDDDDDDDNDDESEDDESDAEVETLASGKPASANHIAGMEAKDDDGETASQRLPVHVDAAEEPPKAHETKMITAHVLEPGNQEEDEGDEEGDGDAEVAGTATVEARPMPHAAVTVEQQEQEGRDPMPWEVATLYHRSAWQEPKQVVEVRAALYESREQARDLEAALAEARTQAATQESLTLQLSEELKGVKKSVAVLEEHVRTAEQASTGGTPRSVDGESPFGKIEISTSEESVVGLDVARETGPLQNKSMAAEVGEYKIAPKKPAIKGAELESGDQVGEALGAPPEEADLAKSPAQEQTVQGAGELELLRTQLAAALEQRDEAHLKVESLSQHIAVQDKQIAEARAALREGQNQTNELERALAQAQAAAAAQAAQIVELTTKASEMRKSWAAAEERARLAEAALAGSKAAAEPGAVQPEKEKGVDSRLDKPGPELAQADVAVEEEDAGATPAKHEEGKAGALDSDGRNGTTKGGRLGAGVAGPAAEPQGVEKSTPLEKIPEEGNEFTGLRLRLASLERRVHVAKSALAFAGRPNKGSTGGAEPSPEPKVPSGEAASVTNLEQAVAQLRNELRVQGAAVQQQANEAVTTHQELDKARADLESVMLQLLSQEQSKEKLEMQVKEAVSKVEETGRNWKSGEGKAGEMAAPGQVDPKGQSKPDPNGAAVNEGPVASKAASVKKGAVRPMRSQSMMGRQEGGYTRLGRKPGCFGF